MSDLERVIIANERAISSLVSALKSVVRYHNKYKRRVRRLHLRTNRIHKFRLMTYDVALFVLCMLVAMAVCQIATL